MKKMKKEHQTVVMVGNYFGDWWDLRACTFLFVSDKTSKEMSEDYDFKWWRYFEDNNEKLIDEIYAPKYISELIKENNEMRIILNEHGLLSDVCKCCEGKS
jgi:hypothetical protein